MKHTFAVLLFASSLLPIRVHAQPPQVPVAVGSIVPPMPSYLKDQLATPEGTARAFYQSLNTPVWSAQLVQGAQLENLAEYERELRKAGEGIRSLIQDVRIEPNGEQGGEQVTARVKISFFHDWASPFFRISREERLTLQREGEIWKIVPGNPHELLKQVAQGADTNYLLGRATALAHPEIMFSFMHTGECRSNLKQLGLGMLQMFQDYSEKYDIAKAAQQYRAMNNDPNMDWENIPAFAQAIYPYVKSGEIFHCPSDAETFVSYSFNPNLRNITMAALTEPAQTVLLYEGANGVLNFRHDGKANVAFTDGHVESVDAERAKTLKWKP